MIEDMMMYKKCMAFSALLCTMIIHPLDVTPWIVIKPSYFLFYQSPMNEIYEKGGFQVQSSLSVPVIKYLDGYFSVGYRQVWGHALNTGEKTSLAVIPFDLGIQPTFKVSERWYGYFAVGPRFFFFQQNNKSVYVASTVKASGIGVFANAGFNALLADHFLLGLFGEYSYEQKMICPTTPNVYSSGNAQLGGLAFGLSFGYAF